MEQGEPSELTYRQLFWEKAFFTWLRRGCTNKESAELADKSLKEWEERWRR